MIALSPMELLYRISTKPAVKYGITITDALYYILETVERKMYETFSDEDKALCKFDWYFNTFTRSFTDLHVSPKHISGRQDIEINDQQRIEDDMQQLEFDVVDYGCWLGVYQTATGDFDIVNFDDEISVIKVFKDFEYEKGVKTFIVRRQM